MITVFKDSTLKQDSSHSWKQFHTYFCEMWKMKMRRFGTVSSIVIGMPEHLLLVNLHPPHKFSTVISFSWFDRIGEEQIAHRSVDPKSPSLSSATCLRV